MFHAREMANPERGEMILNRLAEDLDELAVVEQRPQQDGRNMTMMLGPGKAVLEAKEEPKPEEAKDEPKPAAKVEPEQAPAEEKPDAEPEVEVLAEGELE